MKDDSVAKEKPMMEIHQSLRALIQITIIATLKEDSRGTFRDDIEVIVQMINRRPFRGNLTRKEAKHIIFKEIIGF